MLALEVTENNEYIFHGRSFQITKDKNALLAPYGKMVFNYGVVLGLLPTDTQKQQLSQQIGNARFVRNKYLEERNKLYSETKETLSVADYKKHYLPKLKEEYPFLKFSDKFALEAALERVQAAFDNFFEGLKEGRNVGKPKMASKFKPNGNSYETKFTNNNIELLMVDNLPYIKIPKVDKIRFVLPIGQTLDTILPKNTRITSITIKRSNDDYTVSLQLERIVDIPEQVENIKVADIISMDMGLKHFAVYGNSQNTIEVENPRFIKIHEKRIRRLQKALSRKHKGSNNYKKAKAKLAKEHHKVKNQRRDFHHKLSRKIVNQCKVFACEDLNIKGMIKNKRLSKSIASVGWGQFLRFVKYKMERKGGIFIKVNRFFASSQLCSCCGYKNPDIRDLSIRNWTCPKCGINLDRDINAKTNLITEAIRILNTDYNIKVLTT